MSPKTKKLSNPFSTGGGGVYFETRVQAAFAVLMLTDGFVPYLPSWPITKIKLQGKYAGFNTDDLVVFVKEPNGNREAKLLVQIKHTINITRRDKTFGEVIYAAWSDFQNQSTFTFGVDAIALITGPLSATEINDTRWILEWARHCGDSKEFITKVEMVKFSSRKKRSKLEAFRFHLKKANGGVDVSDDKLWKFMKSFHLLGYDLDIEVGVTLSLFQSLIAQYSQEKAVALWDQLVGEVQSANQNAGTITVDSVSSEIRHAFQKREAETIPTNFVQTPTVPGYPSWNQSHYANSLVIAGLLGEWNEKVDADKEIIKQLVGRNYENWIKDVREVLQQSDSPVSLKNGIWVLTKRLEVWKNLGPRIFDDLLDRLKICAVNVLTESDPQFELPSGERYAASIHGKVLTYSYHLRKGLAESLALLGSHPTALTNCSFNKSDTITVLAVREILDGADWVLWGSLNDLLPLFAEAAPREFLNVVESALKKVPCPFSVLFTQEGSGVFGRNYMTGLLWALETLAWDEQYLTRVTVILGELAALDPGGNWVNRPAHSLETIFLPWLPQTTASIEKRITAVQTLQKEMPQIAWKLLLGLLPNQHQVSSGSHKPVWREIVPEDWKKEVTQKEYWVQVSAYAEMAVKMSQTDFAKLGEIIQHLDNLPRLVFDNLLSLLSSNTVKEKTEEERLPLWTALVDFTTKHKAYSDAKWALSSDTVEKIDRVAGGIAPQNPLHRYLRLFSERDFDLYEEKGNWEEQIKKLEERRQKAICEIIAINGVETVIRFADTVDSPHKVGLSLGLVADNNADTIILPKFFDIKDSKLIQFIKGFVWGRYQSQGWKWVDQIDTSGWTKPQTGRLLVCLPFTNETWKRSENLLGDDEAEYWNNVDVNPYQAKGDLCQAIDKLLEHSRPNAAVSCLYTMLHDKQPLDKGRIVKALLVAVSSTEPIHSMDAYHTVEIIKAMQNDPNTNPEDLFRVEWAYLPLLDQHDDASPKLLERRLATNPSFFCEVIRLVYRSKNESESDKELTEQQKNIATNAYHLLSEWRTPPGSQKNGTYNGDALNVWLENVKVACAKSGHLKIALLKVGGVLTHAPRDPDDLWIHHSVAKVLNAKDANDMRDGFRTELFNSRGVHSWTAGREERELAKKYRVQADEVEACSYHRLATSLRELADSYEHDAERQTSED